MSNNLRTDFIRAEDTLLTLLHEDPSALEDFSELWSALANRLSLFGEEVDEETLIVARRVSSRVEFISKQMLELHEKADAYSLALQNDLNELVTKISLADEDVSPHKLQIPPKSHLPSLIRPAYAWLLHNLHNPYPSKETKRRIARAGGSSLKDIENWFVSVRKRIGWNRLRLRQFSNKRSSIVDAAKRIFLPDSQITTSSLVPQKCCEADFITIKINAETLYPREQLSQDEFPEIFVTGTNASTGRASSERLHARHRARAALAYPSPERSPEPHFVNNTSTLKRRQSFNESSSDSEFDDLHPPSKRQRVVEVNPSFPDFSGLPSPAASLPELGSGSDTLTDLSSTLALPSPSALSKKRKRSISLEENSLSPKRICPDPQRLHVVSNSQPSVYCLPHDDQSPDDLFNPELPPAITTVNLASLDPSLEVDIFEWNLSLLERPPWTTAAMGQICEPTLLNRVVSPFPQTNGSSFEQILTDDFFFQTGSTSQFLGNSLPSHTLESSFPSGDLSFLGLYRHPDDSPFGVSISHTDWPQSSSSFTSRSSLPCIPSTDEFAWNFDAKFPIDVASSVSQHHRMRVLRNELLRLEATL